MYAAFWEAAKFSKWMGAHEGSDWYLRLPAEIPPLRYSTGWQLDLVWDRHVE